MIYVAHAFGGKKANIRKARKITHDLAKVDSDNTYVCPLLCFNYFKYNEVGYDAEMQMCTDLLGECMKMIVASPISKGVQLEIDYCNEWGIPIEYFDYRRENKCRILHKLLKPLQRVRAYLRATRFSLWLTVRSWIRTGAK